MAPKVVVITGCSTGIGLDTAVLLANDTDGRFKVFATMRNLAKQDALQTAAGATLNKTLFIRELDVTKEESIAGFMEKINRDEGGVDILINNAGVGQSGVIDKVTLKQIRSVFDTNIIGLIRLTQAVIPGMRLKRSGHIINVTSFAGLLGFPFCDVYVASKFAVEGFSESIAAYLAQFNVHVSVVEPGPVFTAFVENMSSNDLGSFGAAPSEDADELTQELMKKLQETMANFISTGQKGEDVAIIIKEAILADKPHLRYPTSEVVRAGVAGKYKDPDGDSIVKMINQQSGWTQ